MGKLITLFAGVALGAIFASAAEAATKTLVLGDDSNSAVVAILGDLTGTDSRFDHVNSGAYDLSSGALPTATYLAGFDSVLVFSDRFSVNYTDLSNELGNYVNGGGRVVISTFWGLQAAAYGGLLNSTGFNPLINPTKDAYSPQGLGTHDATSPLLAGVKTLESTCYNGDYRTGLDAGATLTASWGSGRPLEAISASGKVIAITLNPNVVTLNHATGDYRPLFANALAFGGDTVPEPASWVMMIVGFGLVGVAARRRTSVVTA